MFPVLILRFTEIMKHIAIPIDQHQEERQVSVPRISPSSFWHLAIVQIIISLTRQCLVAKKLLDDYSGGYRESKPKRCRQKGEVQWRT